MESIPVTSREQLEEELRQAEEELADMEEERRAFLGQIGVHIGVGLLKTRRRQFDEDERRLRGRIASIKAILQEKYGENP